MNRRTSRSEGTAVIEVEDDHGALIQAGYGACADCSCTGFQGGSGVYTCSRGGCSHHYDRHW